MGTSVRKVLTAMLMVAAFGVTTQAMGASFTCNPNMWVANGTAGSETVEVIGTSTTFKSTGVVSVQVGSFPVVTVASGNTVVIDDLHLTFLPPVGTKGIYSVTVNMVGGGTVVVPNGFSYTTPNKTLQVNVRMTVGRNVSVFWATGTDLNDTVTTPKSVVGSHPGGAADITPYVWYVRDSEFGVPNAPAQINLNATYHTDVSGTIFSPADTDNGHKLLVGVSSLTNSGVTMSAIASDSVPYATGTANPVQGAQNWANNSGAAVTGKDLYLLTGALNPVASIASGGMVANAAKLVTVTTTLPHGFVNGDTVTIVSVPVAANFDGTYTITVTGASTFTYTGPTASVTSSTGATASDKTPAPQLVGNAQAGAVTLYQSPAGRAPGGSMALFLKVQTPSTTGDTSDPLNDQVVTVSLIATGN